MDGGWELESARSSRYKKAETARMAVAEDFVPLQLDSAEDPVIRRREIAARNIAGLHRVTMRAGACNAFRTRRDS